MEDRIEKLEVLLSEQGAVIEDLHEMVRLQDSEIARLKAHMRLLMQRAAEVDSDGTAILADQKPPHW